ncbi:MAG: tRNA lysidine(34) synthetase TilS, partial [Bacteroidota bacterium]
MRTSLDPLLEHVRSSLRQWLPGGGHLLVAVSGGRDSMVLVDALQRLARRLRLRLTLAHVHHGIRGNEADQDRAFVRDSASHKKLPSVTTRVQTLPYRTRHRLSLEEAARILRYRALERLRQRVNADVIVTAHHADDQAETVFLRATRGSGVRGLAGILPMLASPPVIRPLLTTPRSAIERYALRYGIAFRDDSSNRDLRLRRNLVRHRLMDGASDEVGMDLRGSLGRLANAARRLRNSTAPMIDDIERVILTRRRRMHLLSASGLEKLPNAVRNELIVRFLHLGGVEPSRILVASVRRLLESPTGRWIKVGT